VSINKQSSYARPYFDNTNSFSSLSLSLFLINKKKLQLFVRLYLNSTNDTRLSFILIHLTIVASKGHVGKLIERQLIDNHHPINSSLFLLVKKKSKSTWLTSQITINFSPSFNCTSSLTTQQLLTPIIQNDVTSQPILYK
jgi:hypothetical protein